MDSPLITVLTLLITLILPCADPLHCVFDILRMKREPPDYEVQDCPACTAKL